MNTIVLSVDEAARDFANVLRSLRERGDRVVLVDGGETIAEIIATKQPDGSTANRSNEWTGQRVVYSELTGLPVVTAQQARRKITSVEIYARLRNTFP